MRGNRVNVAVAGAANRKDLAVEVGKDHWGHETSMVPAIIDDHPALAPLGRIVAGELPESTRANVVKVDIANQPLALFGDVLPVLPDPIGVADARVFGHGLHDM